MPFQNGFDPSSYGWMEWAIIGGALFVIILVVLLLIFARPRTGNSFLCETTNESIVVSGQDAWLADSHGMTELLRAIDGAKVKLAGKVVYFAKEIKKISVTQEGDQLKRGQTFERQYVTLDFVSDSEIKVGTRSFIAEKALRIRDEKQRAAEAKAAKIQEKEDARAAKLKAKEDAKLAKKARKSQDD